MYGNAYQKAVNIHNILQQHAHGKLLLQGQGHDSRVSVQRTKDFLRINVYFEIEPLCVLGQK